MPSSDNPHDDSNTNTERRSVYSREEANCFEYFLQKRILGILVYHQTQRDIAVTEMLQQRCTLMLQMQPFIAFIKDQDTHR